MNGRKHHVKNNGLYLYGDGENLNITKFYQKFKIC